MSMTHAVLVSAPRSNNLVVIFSKIEKDLRRGSKYGDS
jgi:hypothetical protein